VIDRQRLPTRRRNSTREIQWNGFPWTLTVGWDAEGKVRELFLKGGKLGTHLAIAAEDEAFLVSRLLQRGEAVVDLAASFFPDRPSSPWSDSDTGATKPSLIAVAVQVASYIEQEEGPVIAEMHRAEAARQQEMVDASRHSTV